jgi:hypothetical protein
MLLHFVLISVCLPVVIEAFESQIHNKFIIHDIKAYYHAEWMSTRFASFSADKGFQPRTSINNLV